MNRALTVTLAVLLTTATAQLTPPNLPARPPSAPLVIPPDDSVTLPAVIGQASEVILYAPTLTRADVTEALRVLMTARNARVYVITTKSALNERDSYPLRLALIGATTYVTKPHANAVPFVLVNGRAMRGPGVTTTGTAAWLPDSEGKRLRDWAVQVTKTTKPVNVVAAVREWVKVTQGIDLR